MERETESQWKGLADLAEAGSASDLEQFLQTLPAGDLALAVSRLNDDQQTRVLSTLPPEDLQDSGGTVPIWRSCSGTNYPCQGQFVSTAGKFLSSGRSGFVVCGSGKPANRKV